MWGSLAWLAFTGPSAILLIAFAWGLAESAQGTGWLHGLKLIAVAVVAQAVWGMARSLCPDRERATIAGIAAVALVLWQRSEDHPSELQSLLRPPYAVLCLYKKTSSHNQHQEV